MSSRSKSGVSRGQEQWTFLCDMNCAEDQAEDKDENELDCDEDYNKKTKMRILARGGV